MNASAVMYLIVAPVVAWFALRWMVRRRLTPVLWVFAVGAGLGTLVWGTFLMLAVAGIPEQPPLGVKLMFLCLTVFAAVVSVYSFRHRHG